MHFLLIGLIAAATTALANADEPSRQDAVRERSADVLPFRYERCDAYIVASATPVDTRKHGGECMSKRIRQVDWCAPTAAVLGAAAHPSMEAAATSVERAVREEAGRTMWSASARVKRARSRATIRTLSAADACIRHSQLI
jgi:hypothetical protein